MIGMFEDTESTLEIIKLQTFILKDEEQWRTNDEYLEVWGWTTRTYSISLNDETLSILMEIFSKLVQEYIVSYCYNLTWIILANASYSNRTTDWILLNIEALKLILVERN